MGSSRLRLKGSVEVTVIINHSQAFCLYGVRRRGLGWAPSREGGPIECKEFCWWQEMGRTFRILRGIVMVWGIPWFGENVLSLDPGSVPLNSILVASWFIPMLSSPKTRFIMCLSIRF